MAKKGLGDRADPQILRTWAEDDLNDARLTPPAGVDPHVTVAETTEWRRRRAEDTAVARSMLRWTQIGAIAAIIGIIFAPMPSQKDQPLSQTTSAGSLQQTAPVAMIPGASQAGGTGSQDAQTVPATSQSPPRRKTEGSSARNKAPHSHGGTGFDFVAPSPFANDDIGKTP